MSVHSTNYARVQEESLARKVFLKPWQECVGTYRGLRTSKNEIAIILSLTNGQVLEIFLHKASVEEENVLTELRNNLIGRKIGIMKVDDRENPILIRTLASRTYKHAPKRGDIR